MLLIIASILLVAFSSVSQAAKCPSITTKKDFDVKRYAGLWYEDHRSNVIFEIGSRCVNATYTLKPDGTVGVWNQATGFFGRYNSIKGTAGVKNSAEPGALFVQFDKPNQKGDYNVLDTDYDTYSLVYACRNIPIIGKWEFIWFLSREKNLAAGVVDQLKQKLSSMGISTRSLKKTSQNC